ncbi:hypothetical protein PINS_up020388 [Pythium insidiosum]|nr:hypothetical protein PINS_up020388 [Pythium insidiosum]
MQQSDPHKRNNPGSSWRDGYRKKRRRDEMDMFERGEDYAAPNLLKAMKYSAEAVKGIRPETVRNCWLHSRLVTNNDVGYLIS